MEISSMQVEKVVKKFLSKREFYYIKLTKDQVSQLAKMIKICQETSQKDDNDLELLLLEELRTLLGRKYIAIESQTRFKMTRSQARTLFLWLNEYHFEGLDRIFAYELVEVIFKQLI